MWESKSGKVEVGKQRWEIRDEKVEVEK